MLIWRNGEIATLKVAKREAPKKKKPTAKSAPKEPEVALPDADPAKAVKK